MRNILIALAFTAHATLAGICTISLTHAADVPAQDRASLASENCEHCTHEQQDSAHQKSPCSNGHCFSEAISIGIISNTSFGTSTVTQASLIAFVPVDSRKSASRPNALAPPNPPTITATIVLLM